MFGLREAFNSGDARIRSLLERHAGEPAGYVPQHHLAHVKLPPVRYKFGYRVMDAA